MRVALVHDWLTGMRGGERVLEALLQLYPQAEIYALLHVPGSCSTLIESRPIHTSPIQRLPLARRYFRHFLPFFPAAIGRFDLSGYDLVISTSHCVALGARTGPGTCHVGYCFTPMRYAWDMEEVYLRSSTVGWAKRLILPPLLSWLRVWDQAAATRVDFLACISHHVAQRIRKHYKREAPVIYPPVNVDYFLPGGEPGEFYLVVSAFAPYKRIDLAIEAFNRMGKPLVVIGGGQEEKALRRMAGPTVRILDPQPDSVIRDHYARCRAFVFPGEEDFGIAPLEAQSAGRPVVAYGRGGALETVVDGHTGVLFAEQTPGAIIDAVHRLEATGFDPAKIRPHTLRFGRQRFLAEMRSYVESCLTRHRAQLPVVPVGWPPC